MINGREVRRIYFVGIGGIGMSALARYFLAGGYEVAGYDRSGSDLTDELIKEGCRISFTDDPDTLPEQYSTTGLSGEVVVIYTPAIPATNKILAWFRLNGYAIYKRSEILGSISEKTDTLAVAGTHGKTTVSTILAHLLKMSHVDCTAFLGGISKNYNSNLITGESRYTVMEADEFDRSFLRLKPLVAVITSADADHLDVYGDLNSMLEGYNQFCSLVRPGGYLIVNKNIEPVIVRQPDIGYFTYGLDEVADYSAINVVADEHFYRFDLKTPSGVYRDLHFSFPGIINVENAVAACAAALLSGVMIEEIRKALICFRGVKRRFDIRITLPDIIYIDDYAHHPVEIRAFISSIRAQYPGRKITGVFQPHLFTRTRDHAVAFAEVLDLLENVILMPVYPAREEPIPGIGSEIIVKAMKNSNVQIVDSARVVESVKFDHTDILLTIGAGDIDRLVKPFEEKIRKLYGR